MNTLAYRSLRQYYIAQYIHAGTLWQFLDQKEYFIKQDRKKGREGYAIKTTFSK